jgi:hypothetical protein
MRAFARCIKEDGINKFIEYIKRNQQDGIVYQRSGIMGDYDLPTEEEILALLRKETIVKALIRNSNILFHIQFESIYYLNIEILR